MARSGPANGKDWVVNGQAGIGGQLGKAVILPRLVCTVESRRFHRKLLSETNALGNYIIIKYQLLDKMYRSAE